MRDAAHYLALAADADRFVQHHRVDTEHGVRWRRTDAPNARAELSLYHGSAGILLHQLEWYLATGDPARLALARRAGDEIVATAPQERLSVGFFPGTPGLAFALIELWRATGDDAYRDAADGLLRSLRAAALPLGSGIGWKEGDPFADMTGVTGTYEIIDQSVGACGAGMVLLHAARTGAVPDALDWAVGTADRLLDVAEREPEGWRWTLMGDMPHVWRAPNFAHGSAGVGYFLADLWRATGEQRYLDAALEGARFVRHHALPMGDGCLVRHTEDDVPTIFYLGVCHGPAGTGRLFHLLHDITGDDVHRDFADALLRGALATGVPEQRIEGFWDNHSQCCGDAGLGDYALFLHARTGDPEALAFAGRFADHIESRGTVVEGDDGPQRSWRQLEHRNRPDLWQTATGLFQGAAGIGSFLLHLATTLDGRAVKVPLPDQPFVADPFHPC
ncbi:MAG: hypothetical protein RL238_2506 [Actinomycetota bacterium]